MNEQAVTVSKDDPPESAKEQAGAESKVYKCHLIQLPLAHNNTVYAKVTYIYQKIGTCITYMGVNDMQATHMAVKSIATLISL